MSRPVDAAVQAGTPPSLSIVVVDDHLVFADTFASIVRMAGYVATVVDPRGAFETAARVAQLEPTVAFVDVSLAHFDGCDVAALLRERGSRARLVAITGDWRAETAQRCRDCGFDEVWHKPIDPARLEAFLDDFADRQALQDHGAAAAAGFNLRYAVTVERLLSVINHVRAGVGVAILPWGVLPPGPWTGFQALTLAEPALSVSVGLITLRGRYLTPAASSMMTLVQEETRKVES